MELSLQLLLPLIVISGLLFLAANTLYPGVMRRWWQRKYYQYEVSIGSYMLTPTERFILDSFFFLTLSMILIAASLYLPEHIITISHRAFYYYTGSSSSPSPASPAAVPAA